MKTCNIVAASDFYGELEINENDLVIAVDAGYRHLEKLNIKPDIIIGDFDSAQKPDFENTVCYSPIKDDTDTMLAIKYGLEKGYNFFKIYGGLGGERTDHTIANFQALGYIAQNNGRGVLVGNNEQFTVIKNSKITVNSREGYLSVFAFGGEAHGVSISGAFYELDNANLSPFFPLGVSNCYDGNEVTISVKDGYLLIKY